MSVFDVFFNGHRFPYSNMHELNLDWLIETVKNLSDRVEAFAASIPSVFVKKVDGNAPDPSGNVALPQFVRKIYGVAPDSAGNINPRTTSGNFTVAGDLAATGTGAFNGAVSSAVSMKAPAAYVDGLHFNSGYPEDDYPDITIYQQSKGVLKVQLPGITEGSGYYEQYAGMRIGDPGSHDHDAVNVGWLKAKHKPLQLITTDTPDGNTLAWDDVQFTHDDIEALYTDMVNGVNPCPAILYVGAGTGPSGAPTYMLCRFQYKQGDKYVFFGGADDPSSQQPIDEEESCRIVFTPEEINISRESR